VNRRLQSLRLFGRFLQEMGYAAENPTRGIQLLHNGNGAAPAPRTLTRAEVAQLTQAIRAGRPSLVQRDYAIMQLMLQAGLRVHEIASMRLGDLRATRNGMSIGVGDHGRSGERVVPLKPSAARALRDYLPTRPAVPRVDHLFLSQRGRPLSMRSIQRLIDSHARAVGLEGVCAQSLRHTCTKNMLEETRDLALVARWLGCRDAKSLERFGLGG
jgi:integrase/recombinase XerC